VGLPIPILNEDIAKCAAVKDEDIYTQIVDYSTAYPEGTGETIGEANYKDLKSGSIKIKGKDVPTSSLSSYSKAVEIAESLKKSIKDKKFFLTEPVQPIPRADSGIKFKQLNERPVK
ncbi:MAG: homocysteine biosynthesis protein, partial [Candidatus Omnitrophica bacterium]|nr:homocysteine biosynthesis protein [Candidatus Omnitrophota bacterium]